MKEIDHILQYLKGELDEPARASFEQRLKQDQQFAAEVDEVQDSWNHQKLYDKLTNKSIDTSSSSVNNTPLIPNEKQKELLDVEKILSAAHRNAILKDVESIAQETNIIHASRRYKVWLAAASFLFLFSLAAIYFFYLPNYYSNKALAQKYTILYPTQGKLLNITQTESEASNYKKGMQAYEQQDYENAANAFRMVTNNSPFWSAAQFYLANTLMAQQNALAALPILQQLLQSNQDASAQSRLRWFLSLAALQAGQETLAREQLNVLVVDSSDQYYQKQAQLLQSELNHFWRRLPGIKD